MSFGGSKLELKMRVVVKYKLSDLTMEKNIHLVHSIIFVRKPAFNIR